MGTLAGGCIAELWQSAAPVLVSCLCCQTFVCVSSCHRAASCISDPQSQISKQDLLVVIVLAGGSYASMQS